MSTQFYTVDNAAVSLHRQESDHIDSSSHPLLGLVQMMISFFLLGIATGVGELEDGLPRERAAPVDVFPV